MQPISRIQLTVRSGARWVNYLSRKLRALPVGGTYRRVLDGFLLTGKRSVWGIGGTILDVPPYVLFPSVVAGNNLPSGGRDTPALVSVGASRDLFAPLPASNSAGSAAVTTGRASKPFSLEARNVFFGAPPPESEVRRFFTGITAQPLDGRRSAIVTTLTFNTTVDEQDFSPLEDAYTWWVTAEFFLLRTRPTLRLYIDEATVLSGWGYQFFSRAVGPGTGGSFMSSPVVSAGYGVTPAGVTTAMAVPVAIQGAPYDADTNNNDHGTSGVLFLVVDNTLVTPNSNRSGVLNNSAFAGTPLAPTQWGGANPAGYTGAMPNRIVEGATHVADDGGVYWVGVWETSREIDDAPYYTVLRTLCAAQILPAGGLNFTRLRTDVLVSESVDDPYGYLAEQSDGVGDPSSVVYLRAFCAFAPSGKPHFHAAQGVHVVRSQPAITHLVYLPEAAKLWVYDSVAGLYAISMDTCVWPTVDEAVTGAVLRPQVRTPLSPTGRSQGARICLAVAAARNPVLAAPVFVTGDSRTTLRLVEIETMAGGVTDRGVIAEVAQGDLVTEPTISCYYMGTGVMAADATGTAEARGKEPCYLVSFEDSTGGHTLVSCNGGASWKQIDDKADAVGAYFIGSRLYGRTFSELFA